MVKFNGFKGEYSGLTEEEIIKAQKKYGDNLLVPEKKKRSSKKY